jgi:hypothetical protein
MCNAMFLSYMVKYKKEFDDRGKEPISSEKLPLSEIVLSDILRVNEDGIIIYKGTVIDEDVKSAKFILNCFKGLENIK